MEKWGKLGGGSWGKLAAMFYKIIALIYKNDIKMIVKIFIFTIYMSEFYVYITIHSMSCYILDQ